MGRTAGVVVQEVRRQFADGKIMAGTKKPDYGPVIDICTAASLRELATPALACAILPGTTRSWILGWAERVGLRPYEGWLSSRDVAEADEAFLCSSVAGILPVTSYEGRPIGDGRPGPVTLRARADREAFIAGEVS